MMLETAPQPTLLYNGECSRCCNIATKVQGCSNGRIAILALGDEAVEQFLDSWNPDRKFRPLLVEFPAGVPYRISSTLMMGWRMLKYVPVYRIPKLFWLLTEWL